MDEEELEQPRKKITISNFFESIQTIDKVANRALKKTNSNLGIINSNKSLIEALSKSFNDIVTEVKEIKEYITIKDEDKDKLFSQEDQEQKIKRLERLQGIGDKPLESTAGTTDDSDFKKQAAETVKKAFEDPNIMQMFTGLIGLSVSGLFGLGLSGIRDTKERTFIEGTGGIIDALSGNITDFDKRGGKPVAASRAATGIIDFFTANMFDLDKRGGLFESKESFEKRQKINEKIKEEKKNRPKKGLMRLLPFNLGGEVKDNDNDTSNNDVDSVPAVLTPGEFVVTKDAVEKVGVDTLEGLNASVGATNKASNLGKFSIERLDPKDISKNTLIKKYSFADGVSDVEISNESGRDYFKSTTDMSTGGLNEKTVKRTRFTETSEDGTVTVFDKNTEMTEKIVSIGVPDLIEHKDQLLGEIHKLKGFENITIDQVINQTTGIPQEKLLPILLRSDAQRATDEKQDKAREEDRKARGIEPGQSFSMSANDEIAKSLQGTIGYRIGQINPDTLVSSMSDLKEETKIVTKTGTETDPLFADLSESINASVKGFNQGGLVEGVKKMYSSEIEENKSKNNLKPLLDMIGSGESDNVGGYSAMFPSESYPKMLDMTINEVIEFQKEKLKDGRRSAAVGRYQMLYPEDYAAAAGLPLTTKFTPESQDKMVIAYLKKNRKLNEFIKGEITNEQFSEELSQEFGTFKSASGFVLPNNTGSIDFPMMVPVLN